MCGDEGGMGGGVLSSDEGCMSGGVLFSDEGSLSGGVLLGDEGGISGGVLFGDEGGVGGCVADLSLCCQCLLEGLADCGVCELSVWRGRLFHKRWRPCKQRWHLF